MAVLEEFEKVFDTTICEGYGLSETSPTATVNQWSFGTRAGTVGHSVYPRVGHVLPELPVGPSQKVLKRELRRRSAPRS